MYIATFLISRKSATEGSLHLGGYTVFMKRMWTTMLFLYLVVSC